MNTEPSFEPEFEPVVLAWQCLVVNTHTEEGYAMYIGQGWHPAAGSSVAQTFPDAQPFVRESGDGYSFADYILEGVDPDEITYEYFLTSEEDAHGQELIVAAIARSAAVADAWKQQGGDQE